MRRFGNRSHIHKSFDKVKLFGCNRYRTRWFGGDDEQQSAPAFKPDPYVEKTQSYLFPYATSILEGKPNDYYGAIGQWGGPEYQKMMNLVNRDTTNATNENLTRRGISRSGLGADIVSKTVGDASTKMTWADYNRAMSGRQWLGGWGSGMMEGVRGAGLTNQSQQNQYALQEYQLNQQNQNQDDNMWAQLLSSGIGAVGNMIGMGQLGQVAGNTITGSSGMGSVGGYKDFADTSSWMLG